VSSFNPNKEHNMSSTPTFPEYMQTVLDQERLEAAEAIKVALAKVEEARQELDHIQRHLEIARDGDEEFSRIGRIQGLDSHAVFAAFGHASRTLEIEDAIVSAGGEVR